MQRVAEITEITKQEVERQLGTTITEAIYNRAYERAKRKLARIIEREGDMGGERLQPYYLTQLTAEAVREQSFSDFTISLCELLKEADRYIEQKEMPAVETAGQI